MLLDNVSVLTQHKEESARPALAAESAAEFPSQLELPAGEVHVWLANLDAFTAEDLRGLLAEDELQRAQRFVFEKDRNHFTVARGLLRKLLASYLGSDAVGLKFAYEEKGKPWLSDAHEEWLSFNLAHSHGLALFAVSRERELGIDLEFIREDVEHEQLAERFFSAAEAEALRTLPAESRTQAFFNCWTRKEAYIKARAAGLSLPLAEFEVSLLPGYEASLLRCHNEPDEVERWAMKAVTVPAGYVGALVGAGKDWQLKEFVLE